MATRVDWSHFSLAQLKRSTPKTPTEKESLTYYLCYKPCYQICYHDNKGRCAETWITVKLIDLQNTQFGAKTATYLTFERIYCKYSVHICRF